MASPKVSRREPAAGPGCRCIARVAATRRAEGRGQGDRPAEGHADRGRGSRSHRDAEQSRRSRRRTIRRSPPCRPRPRTESRRSRRRPRGRRWMKTRPEAETGEGARTSASARTSSRLDRRLGPQDQRLFRAAQALSAGQEEQGDHGQGEPRAQPRCGNVVSVGVLESSGDAAFDEAAIAMIRRSDPVPRPAGRTDAGYVQLQPECELQRAEVTRPIRPARARTRSRRWNWRLYSRYISDRQTALSGAAPRSGRQCMRPAMMLETPRPSQRKRSRVQAPQSVAWRRSTSATQNSPRPV